MVCDIVILSEFLDNVLVAPKSGRIEISAIGRQLVVMWMGVDHAPRDVEIGRIHRESAAAGARYRAQIRRDLIELGPFVSLEHTHEQIVASNSQLGGKRLERRLVDRLFPFVFVGTVWLLTGA